MNTKHVWRTLKVLLFVALTSVATMGFSFAGDGNPTVFVADVAPCDEPASELAAVRFMEFFELPCDSAVGAIPEIVTNAETFSISSGMDSGARFEAYLEAIAGGEAALNAASLNTSASFVDSGVRFAAYLEAIAEGEAALTASGFAPASSFDADSGAPYEAYFVDSALSVDSGTRFAAYLDAIAQAEAELNSAGFVDGGARFEEYLAAIADGEAELSAVSASSVGSEVRFDAYLEALAHGEADLNEWFVGSSASYDVDGGAPYEAYLKAHGGK